MNFFPHLDLGEIVSQLNRLTTEGISVAYHADADGAISATLLTQLAPVKVRWFANVLTEQLSLLELAEWAKQRGVANLVTLDINVWSTSQGLNRLASSVSGDILVIDDHVGEMGSLPQNVRFVNLLPVGPKRQSREQIRPSFLFVDAILRRESGRSGLSSFLSLAGLYGEGVDHLFYLREIAPAEKTKELARMFGRGLTSVFLAGGAKVDNNDVVLELINLVEQGPIDEDIDAAAIRAVDSSVGNKLRESLRTVSKMVHEEALQIEGAKPWLATAAFDVFLLQLKATAWIVNLVASETRNRLRSGVTVAVQERAHGVAIELRRTRDLAYPDLAQLLLDMEPSLFVARGGHPMAAGATVVLGRLSDFLSELRGSLSAAGRPRPAA